ncbi:GGDEF domain-containing protein [Piscinibacter sp.]|uniref:GGDEF domain-containing protein n=1 Tax=Piscinibacter sp. TaxID=1903157 RepID=UPI002BC6C2E3|nr:GGDEF domain-containing protein [Albitalea sp.]HUG24479.1 GGDEF domain-containing protein [Albitalea sp.]
MSRFTTDFQLAIITLFGVLAALGIAPFAVYRFVTGSFWIGVLDTGIVVCILSAVVYAWHSGKTARVGLILACVNTTGTVLATALLGYPGLFWAYPTLLANYLLVDRKKAVAATAIALTALVLLGRGFDSTLQTILFVVTAAIVSLFAFIFAYRTEVQRQQLEAAAALDALTGANNRRVLDDELQIAVEKLARHGAPAAVLMFDLDHFKVINDRHGHAVGDKVLIEFSALIRASTRQVDRFFRYGGEEFVLLLSPTSTASLGTLADKLVRTVAAKLRCAGEPVTVSVGGATLRPGDDVRTWMARADACMYRAKQLGRNRAEYVGDEEPRAVDRRERGLVEGVKSDPGLAQR